MSKVSYLNDLAAESRAPFISITETHLTTDILSAEVHITGYTLYRSDRLGGRTHGGCAFYCQNDITVIETSKYSNNCCECQILELKELELILINIYRPPNSPKQLFKVTLEKCQVDIEEIMDKETNKSKTLMVTGDFNFPFIKWPETKIHTSYEEPEKMASEKIQAKMLIDWSEKNFLEQIIISVTRGKNILDLIFTNSETLITSY